VTLVATAAAILPQFLREIIGSPNIATRVENSRFLLPNGARVPGQDRIPRSCSQPTVCNPTFQTSGKLSLVLRPAGFRGGRHRLHAFFECAVQNAPSQ
jgi:hypothetical protein